MKQELKKLSFYLSEYSNVHFPGDVVASLLDDLFIGVSADEIIADLNLDPDDHDLIIYQEYKPEDC